MATVATRTYSFTLTIAGGSELTPEMAEAIFAAGADDATPFGRDGRAFVAFDREAGSLGDAIGSAIRDVERAGLGVVRVEVEPSGD